LAIVSDEPGTTRDLRETALDLDGQLVVLVDMAGLRDTQSKAEAEGVRRARLAIEEADLVLWLTAPDVEGVPSVAPLFGTMWQVAAKADLAPCPIDADLAVSARTGAGIDDLMRRLGHFAAEATAGEPALISRERDHFAIERALAALAGAQTTKELELIAESLRAAALALARLTGRVDAEMVLDRLFSAFCIGK
jgi:tRNA modification GTPase